MSSFLLKMMELAFTVAFIVSHLFLCISNLSLAVKNLYLMIGTTFVVLYILCVLAKERIFHRLSRALIIVFLITAKLILK